MSSGKRPQELTRFHQVILDYRPHLHRYLRSKLGSPEDVEDIAQEAYLRLLRVDLPELIKRPQDYLFRIASNVVHDFYLKRRQQPDFVDYDYAQETGGDEDKRSLESDVEHRDSLRKLETILKELPPIQQAVFLLKKRDGLSHEEIAAKLDISVHTSRAYVSRTVAYCRLRGEEQA
ncbi:MULTISPECIES: RNA polymerase sigma factor [Kordiimonas]|jgi:RNA polymerase sigma-70 factor (ECF subfamily)|uniref:RNA polymerase sigma factor n=1 Tax=Kordiimonas TaxID=288021 RepID=UPI002579E268|nr:RNA polymerase sigma factor [Kordiimonas sp. UBA4487]